MPTDHAAGSDGAAVRVLDKAEAIAQARAAGAWVIEGRARVEKYHADDDPATDEPYEVVESEPNLFLTAGITLLWQLATGQGGTSWSQGNARLAVGSGTTAAVVGDTALQNQLSNGRRPLDTSGITVSGNAVTFVATFSTGDANGDWRECGVINAASGGTLLNRLVQNLGTKTASAQWILQLTLSIQSA